jgi:murein DD-endopeptidase MepM/ murein hydrolase activator NlpD
VTSYRVAADPYAAGQHRGIDVAAPVAAPVVAAAPGTVRFAGRVGSSGLTVSVRTADGRYETSYLHLSATSVQAGEQVEPGERIGAAGTSGRPSSATPHLHFGVRTVKGDAYRDPLGFLAPRSAPRTRDVPHGGPAPIAFFPAHRFPARKPVRVAPPTVDRGWAVACLALISLAAAVGRSSIGAPCPTTSPRRSTTSTASPTSATSTRPSPPTSSPGTCASAATTSSS